MKVLKSLILVYSNTVSARNYGYIYSSEKENIYLLIKKNKSNRKKYNYDTYPENAIRLIKNRLKLF